MNFDIKTFATYTLGCKVNQYETVAIEELFSSSGYEKVEFDLIADIYIINTCTVTGMSEKKCRQIIRRCKKNNPEGIVVVVGCYSQKEPAKVLEIEGVNLVFGTSNRGIIVNEVEKINSQAKKILVNDIMSLKEFEDMNVKGAGDRARAYVKVQDGCDRYCSYCIIPYTRGGIRSRSLKLVVSEVEELVKNGYLEIVLTGIHIASYGKEQENVNIGIKELIESVSKVNGLKRLRISSMEPLVITDELLKSLISLDNFCPHFHLSLQSGSNSVLKRMNRRYTTEEYRTSLEKIRKFFPNSTITTDVIVGFPGETNEEFEETRKFLEDINLYEMHIFKYSKREGTPAATMKRQVDEKIKSSRSNILLNMSNLNKIEHNKTMIGCVENVLFESNHDGFWIGHTANYTEIRIKNKKKLVRAIFDVKIIKEEKDYLIGELI